MPDPAASSSTRNDDIPRVIGKRFTATSGIALVLFLCCLVCGCARHQDNSYSELALPSGERVTIIDAHGDSFTNVSGVKRHIYYIGYLTAHDFEDIPALRKEAQRVWAAYRPQIIGIDYDSCVVTPMKKTPGASEEGRPFYLNRNPDGTWTMQP